MSKEAFDKLCEWKQTIEKLPLEKWEEGLRQKFYVIRHILIANQEDPEKLRRQILETIRNITTMLYYL
jgi:hypothetical protein